MTSLDPHHTLDAVPRKPRIALMGEFSAGKSTLMNLLLGCDPMPVRITATRVPPVWVRHGPRGATLIREDGTELAYEGDDLNGAPMEGTEMIQFSMDSDILNLCDLIDIPGISDPNLKHETWLSLIGEVDCVIWCTHATQAWRQSEAALWEQISEQVKGPNHLVVTQFDKLRSDRDQARVLARLEAEAGAVFDAIVPIATLAAINAGMDETAWRDSGGAALIERMVTMLVNDTKTPPPQANINAAAVEEVIATPMESDTAAEVTRFATPNVPNAPRKTDAATGDDAHIKVVPRRIRPKSPNPDRPSSEDLQSAALQTYGRSGDL